MSETAESEGPVDIQALAAQMLGLDDNESESYEEEEDDSEEQPVGHPAWQAILSKIPQEYHDVVIPTLQNWDTGVSRRFQKIHDEYAPYREIAEEYDPDAIREAMGVYNALNQNPAATWETIGRVYGLSPQYSQAISDDDEEDVDIDDLPSSIRERLAKIDQHDNVLEYMSQFVLDQQTADEQAQEDAELDETLNELHEAYGDFDEDYVIGLIAGGIDPEDAVARFQYFVGQYEDDEDEDSQGRQYLPQVMSSGGGIPDMGSINVNSLSNQDMQGLVAEILRLSQDQ